MFKSESLVKLAPALLAAQKKMGVALKDSKNPFFKSKYADLNAIIDASIPTLNEEGISVLQTMASGEKSLGTEPTLQTVLLHESGEFIGSSTPIVCSKQNDPQALGSAISYARRYGLQAATVLKAEDDDAETATTRESKSTPADTKNYGSFRKS